MKTKSIKWGIIGCGNVTEIKSGPAYQQVEGFELYAVMRRDIKKAEDYALRHSVPKFYETAQELINDSNVDAVYIATPPDSHKEYALQVAHAGKICCIEKPMAPSYSECQEIVEAFSQKKLPLYVAYYRRSLPYFEKIRDLIETEEIGQIRHVNWQLHRSAKPVDLSEEYNWRTDSKIAPGGYFDDLASHGLDLFVHYFGEVAMANGMATNQQKLYSSNDAILGSWVHKSGVTGSGSWIFSSEKVEDRVEVYGTHGKITFSMFTVCPIHIQIGAEEREITIDHPKHIQKYHVENLKYDLMGERSHPSTGKTGSHTAWIMDQILKEQVQ